MSDFFGSAQSIEHYTPPYIWKRAVKAMGGIDLDPASDGSNIPAKLHFTKITNGLIHPWLGRVWLNPPFGNGITLWFEKLSEEFEKGNTTEAIVLWKSAMETRAMRILLDIPQYKYSAVPRRRISFMPGGYKKRGGGNSATFTPLLHYFGTNGEQFYNSFIDIADIWVCVYHGNSNQTRIQELDQ